MRFNYWIFDMDGTLTDSMGIWDKLPFVLLEKLSRQPKPELRFDLLPLGMTETARYMISEYDLPMTEEEFNALSFQTIRELYRTVSLKPGVREILDRLKSQGAKLCICSNTWQAMCEEVLTRLGVRDCFEFILSAQNGLNKHDPHIFYESMRRLGASSSAQCLVCEDAVYAARTAHSAGFSVLGIADVYSRADEAELRTLSEQFLPDWTALDWSRV